MRTRNLLILIAILVGVVLVGRAVSDGTDISIERLQNSFINTTATQKLVDLAIGSYHPLVSADVLRRYVRVDLVSGDYVYIILGTSTDQSFITGGLSETVGVMIETSGDYTLDGPSIYTGEVCAFVSQGAEIPTGSDPHVVVTYY